MTTTTKNYYEEVTHVLNRETGELEEVTRTVKRRVSRNQFVMFYFKDIQDYGFIFRLNLKSF